MIAVSAQQHTHEVRNYVWIGVSFPFADVVRAPKSEAKKTTLNLCNMYFKRREALEATSRQEMYVGAILGKGSRLVIQLILYLSVVILFENRALIALLPDALIEFILLWNWACRVGHTAIKSACSQSPCLIRL